MPNSVRERVDTEIDKVLKEYGCLNKSKPNSITTLQGRLSEVIITAISEEVGKMKTGKCDNPVIRHAEYVSHDMAIDAGDRNLEGQIYRHEETERCGGCPSCLKDQIIFDIQELLKG